MQELFCAKLSKANQMLGSDECEVLTTDALPSSDLAWLVHFAATGCGFDGSVESQVVNWLHILMLSVKPKGNDLNNPTWLEAMNGSWAEKILGSCLH